MPTRKESLLTIGAGLFVITVAAYFLSKWQKQKGHEQPAMPSHQAPQDKTPSPSKPMALEEGQYYIPNATSGMPWLIGLIVLKPSSNSQVPSHLINVIEKNKQYSVNDTSDIYMDKNDFVFHFNKDKNLLQLLPHDKINPTGYKLMIFSDDDTELQEFLEKYQKKSPQIALHEYIAQDTAWELAEQKHENSAEYQHKEWLRNKARAITKSQLFYSKSPQSSIYRWQCEALLQGINDTKLNLYTFKAYQTRPRNKRIVLQLKYFFSEQHGILSDFIAWGLIQETDNSTYYLIERQGMYQVGGTGSGEKQVFENIECKDKQEVEQLTKQFLSKSGK